MRVFSLLSLISLSTFVAAASKRGIGWYDTQANALLTTKNSSITWIYNWSPIAPKTNKIVEFIPMQWGSGGIASLNSEISNGAKYLLGFNEPDGQSNLTPKQAAALWPQLEAVAKKRNFLLGSPATIQRDYTWLADFFHYCKGCKVDFITQHWYGTSLEDFKSMIKTTHNKYKKPIWVTEFAMIQSSPANTLRFLKEAIAFLDKESYVERYAWFGLIVQTDAFLGNNCYLLTDDGKLTDLGKIYVHG